MIKQNNINFTRLDYPSQRMPIFASNCVATSQPLAAQAGVKILQDGGNAVDAAIATAITLTIVEPTANSIGSDAFAIIWDGKNLHGFNGSGRSPKSLTIEMFDGYTKMPQVGWPSVTTPGAVATWVTLSKQFGSLPFEKLFETAIHYAEQGFLVSPIVAQDWKISSEPFKNNHNFAKVFLPNQRAPFAGELFKSKDQAKTLIKIAETKGDFFYHGELADIIEESSRSEGGFLRKEDLAQHETKSIPPLKFQYRGYDVFELTPNGQGLTVLIALGILAQFDLSCYPVDSAESIHLQLEAMKLAFADAKKYIADPTYMTISTEELLNINYLKERAKLIDFKKAKLPTCGIPSEIGTVYLTTADKNGMMVSFIQSHFHKFGSGIVIPNTGILMQNRGASFILEHGHPNQIAGSKLPFHTIIPGFLMKNNKPLMSFGLMGGHMQAQGHVQLMVRLCDYGQSPQSIIDAPRWHISPENKISFESSVKLDVIEALKQKGHEITQSCTSTFGGSQAIYRLKDGYLAASDPRKDGLAIGY